MISGSVPKRLIRSVMLFPPPVWRHFTPCVWQSYCHKFYRSVPTFRSLGTFGSRYSHLGTRHLWITSRLTEIIGIGVLEVRNRTNFSMRASDWLLLTLLLVTVTTEFLTLIFVSRSVVPFVFCCAVPSFSQVQVSASRQSSHDTVHALFSFGHWSVFSLHVSCECEAVAVIRSTWTCLRV